jgi:hypothetical protein
MWTLSTCTVPVRFIPPERMLLNATACVSHAVLRRCVVFLHVTGQIMMRVVMFAYLAVARAEKAMPILMAFAGVSLMFSIHVHGQSGWVVSTLFTFPLWFLAWQSSNSKDLFGWKVGGALVCSELNAGTGKIDD